MLTEEYGTASNIKSRVNRLSVLSAITSTNNRLKLYNKVPPNGLVIYCGTVLTDDGKEKKVNYDFEPHKPINTSLYLCDNKFHVDCLKQLLESDDKFGFVIMDGSGSLFGTLSGNTREVLYKFLVDLPKKHGRGGQSSVRFARLRLEKRHNYLRKVAEICTQLFIRNNVPNVTGLVLAGLADFKNELNGSDMFDQRLKRVVVGVVDCSYGFENGFNQAIELSSDILGNVKFIQEKKLISKFFEEIAQDTGKVCYGVKETLYALENGAVQTLIVYESLDIIRCVMKRGDQEKIVYLRPDQLAESDHYKDRDGLEMDIKESQELVEWFAENFKKFGASLQFVTDKSQEGSQFVQGFGGVGGILRYKFDVNSIEYLENQEIPEEDDAVNEDDWDIFY